MSDDRAALRGDVQAGAASILVLQGLVLTLFIEGLAGFIDGLAGKTDDGDRQSRPNRPAPDYASRSKLCTGATASVFCAADARCSTRIACCQTSSANFTSSSAGTEPNSSWSESSA